MGQRISPDTIKKGTGKSWQDWLEFFESIDAANLSHKEIAEQASTLGGAPSWWRQMVAVAYEQHIGRRFPGQDSDGQYSVSVSKTMSVGLDEAMAAWVALVGDCTEFSNVAIVRGPDLSHTDKWRYWRCSLADGSRLNVYVYLKPPNKSVLGIDHNKLELPEQVDHWRAYWQDLLTQGFDDALMH